MLPTIDVSRHVHERRCMTVQGPEMIDVLRTVLVPQRRALGVGGLQSWEPGAAVPRASRKICFTQALMMSRVPSTVLSQHSSVRSVGSWILRMKIGKNLKKLSHRKPHVEGFSVCAGERSEAAGSNDMSSMGPIIFALFEWIVSMRRSEKLGDEY